MSAGLRLSGVVAGYGRTPVLTGIDLPVLSPGSVVAVLGSNGAGKSTLLKALAGLRTAQGRAELDGDDLLRMPAGKRMRAVGYLPQALPQASTIIAYEAVLSALRAIRPDLSRQDSDRRIEAVFDTLGLRRLALRHLNQLSGGQRQMVGLAQVLVRHPRLLLLDEPTSALDLRWQISVLETVRRIADTDGSVCLIAIHDLNLALRFCDQVVVLGGGRAIAVGSPDQALDPMVLRQAYGIEARVERCSRGFPLVLADRALTCEG
jgi:iron complex transport system ATP-binding protein